MIWTINKGVGLKQHKLLKEFSYGIEKRKCIFKVKEKHHVNFISKVFLIKKNEI